ncbi:MAG: [Fe-Fe] hydrogenase large subunit C-terminal domain-containing protein [Rikenellaceae bacterium]
MNPIFYIEKGDCANCYQCVRVCPVDAISINDFQASIIPSRCINCAKCADVCPQNLIKFSPQIEKCKNIIRNNNTIIASISPTWVGEFKNISISKIVEALKLLGFTHVNETTLGADVVINESFKKIKESNKDLNITTHCTVVNNLIMKRFPNLIDNMLTVETPVIAHARQLKQIYGDDVKIINISGCVATRSNLSEYEGLISASITYNELKEWLKEEKISMRTLLGVSSYDFEPVKAKEHTEYIVAGGAYNKQSASEMVSPNCMVVHASGLNRVAETLENIGNVNFYKKVILELFACSGGCIFGDSAAQKRDQFVKLNKIKDYDLENLKNPTPNMPIVSLNKNFYSQYINDKIDGSTVIQKLQKLTIDTSKEYLNCGACGYSDCKVFVKQMIQDYAHKEMCLWFRKSSAKMSLMTFIKMMPFGVAIVDSALTIRSSNLNFARAMGPEAILAFETYPLLKKRDAKAVMPSLIEYIEDVFKNKNTINKDIQIKDKLFKLSIIKIDNIDRVVVIVRNAFQSEIQNDEIITRTRSVIDDNLKTVQQIAYLLGETAARTEAVLHSIIDSQNKTDESI